MTPRPPAVGPQSEAAGRHAAPPRRGVAAAVIVAMIGIGAGTWFLGSEPDSAPATPDGSFSTVAVLPEVPEAEQAPALSVAPAPSEAAYAAARRASERASRTGGKAAAPAKKKPVKANAADPASTDVVASG